MSFRRGLFLGLWLILGMTWIVVGAWLTLQIPGPIYIRDFVMAVHYIASLFTVGIVFARVAFE